MQCRAGVAVRACRGKAGEGNAKIMEVVPLGPKNKSKISHFRRTPEESNNKVFNKGIAKGSSASIPEGGREEPTKTSGDKLAWKNPQNTLKKAITSLIINKANPIFKPR